jgi:hypothetical protein
MVVVTPIVVRRQGWQSALHVSLIVVDGGLCSNGSPEAIFPVLMHASRTGARSRRCAHRDIGRRAIRIVFECARTANANDEEREAP